ncbi:MAG: Gfo/Idh/MocA family oxidoreductase [Rhodobacteraceae bacterium]|nr:Gfo/Idh/MocA family oxidoreductase [Paracoccaceae bacterium]MCF8521050.1 Gfo/Idh/MocA family oxidoreductase [Paracoccaceae bacterium]
MENDCLFTQRALIIGQGSIGRRHAQILAARGLQVAVVSRQTDTGLPTYSGVAEAIAATAPGYVVIATATADHKAGVEALVQAGFRGRLLVEKPLAMPAAMFAGARFERAAVAYNLRFHPVLGALQAHLAEDPARLISVHCGQHLSTWRPGRDHRSSYSADAAQGGGALRDLSHDLNYLEWLCGPAASVSAMGGNLGILGINADEAWSILVETNRGVQASITLNYLDQPARRQIVATTAHATLTADMIASTLSINGETTHFPVIRNTTYDALHDAMLGAPDPRLCALNEAYATDRLIAATLTAARTKSWTTP